jgi:hypothetical protein
MILEMFPHTLSTSFLPHPACCPGLASQVRAGDTSQPGCCCSCCVLLLCCTTDCLLCTALPVQMWLTSVMSLWPALMGTWTRDPLVPDLHSPHMCNKVLSSTPAALGRCHCHCNHPTITV